MRQSFSHGRIESGRRREGEAPRAGPGRAHPPREGSPRRPPPPPPPRRESAPSRPCGRRRRSVARSGVILRSLTEEEREARSRALSGAREREDRRAQARRDRGQGPRTSVRPRAEERAAAEARKHEEEARRARGGSQAPSEQEAKRRLAGGEPAPRRRRAFSRRGRRAWPPRPPAPRCIPPGETGRADADEEEARHRVIRRPGAPTVIAIPRPATGAEQRDRGRLTVANVTGDEDERTRSVAAFAAAFNGAQGPCREHEGKDCARR